MEWRRIMVTGGRGGCGRSTVAAGLACALAKRGVKVTLLDFDLSERSLDMYLGCEDRAVYDWGDLLVGGCRPGDAVIHPFDMEALCFIPGVYHLRRPPDMAEAERLFSSLEAELAGDLMIVDTSSVADPSVKLCAALCDAALVTATPDALSLRSNASLCEWLHEEGAGTLDLRLVINRFPVNPKMPCIPDPREMIDSIGIRLFGIVPECNGFTPIEQMRVPSCFGSDHTALSAAFSNMAARLVGEARPLLTGTRLPRRKLLTV
jgi:septum site-determining protein MinD